MSKALSNGIKHLAIPYKWKQEKCYVDCFFDEVNVLKKTFDIEMV